MDLALSSKIYAVVHRIGLVAIAIVVGLLSGQLIVSTGPTTGFGLLAAIVAAALVLRSIWSAIAIALSVVFLVPFMVVPFADSPFTPTIFELTMLLTLVLVTVALFVDRRVYLRLTGEEALWVALLGIIGFAFLLGLGRGYSAETLHNFFKFVLALFAFPLAIQFIRSTESARLMARLLICLSAAASLVALVLYIGGANVTQRVLIRLTPYGYPSSRIVRFIEDDPEKALRAVGTSVDPNALGGLLMVGFVISAGQLLVRSRVVAWPVALVVTLLTAATILLTFSRGAWVGALAGLTVIVLLRRPLLFLPGLAFGSALLLLGAGRDFTERLWMGFTLQDPATRLRLDEYRNALQIIQEHPWFGVGFGEAPSLELQTGVSSIYLTVAEQAGLVGLAAFVLIICVILWRTAIDVINGEDEAAADLQLTLAAAFVGVLTVGLVDHYYFNITFPHMVATFWLLAGTLVAIYSMHRYSRRMSTSKGTRS